MTSPLVGLPRLPPTVSNMPVDDEPHARKGRAPAPVKAARETSEFWVAMVGGLLVLVIAVVARAYGSISSGAFVAMVLCAGVVLPVVWIVARTVLKVIAPTVVVETDPRI